MGTTYIFLGNFFIEFLYKISEGHAFLLKMTKTQNKMTKTLPKIKMGNIKTNQYF